MFFTIQPPQNVMFQHQHGEVLMGVQATAASQDVTRQNHIPSYFFFVQSLLLPKLALHNPTKSWRRNLPWIGWNTNQIKPPFTLIFLNVKNCSLLKPSQTSHWLFLITPSCFVYQFVWWNTHGWWHLADSSSTSPASPCGSGAWRVAICPWCRQLFTSGERLRKQGITCGIKPIIMQYYLDVL